VNALGKLARATSQRIAGVESRGGHAFVDWSESALEDQAAALAGAAAGAAPPALGGETVAVRDNICDLTFHTTCCSHHHPICPATRIAVTLLVIVIELINMINFRTTAGDPSEPRVGGFAFSLKGGYTAGHSMPDARLQHAQDEGPPSLFVTASG
jgi:hypothetical protein